MCVLYNFAVFNMIYDFPKMSMMLIQKGVKDNLHPPQILRFESPLIEK
jgi:hypothetical protein